MPTIRFRRFLLTLLAVLMFVGPVGAADTILSNGRLLLRHDGTGQRAKLSFRATGASLILPDAGGSDDPSTQVGRLEIITREGAHITELSASLHAGQWRRTRSGGWRFHGRKGDEVRRVVISRKGIAIVLRGGASPATGQAGFVAMRLHFGEWRACARFSGAEILRDSQGRLLARHLRSTDLANCEDAELYGACEVLAAGAGDCRGYCGEGSCTYDAGQGCRCSATEPACGDTDPDGAYNCTGSCGAGGGCFADFWAGVCRCVDAGMPCGATFPVCGGTCASGLECKSTPGYPINHCTCEPPGPSCGAAAFPTCGGVCATGQVCAPGGDHLNGDYCGCVTPGADCGNQGPCPAGSYCVLGGSNFFVCLPIP